MFKRRDWLFLKGADGGDSSSSDDSSGPSSDHLAADTSSEDEEINTDGGDVVEKTDDIHSSEESMENDAVEDEWGRPEGSREGTTGGELIEGAVDGKDDEREELLLEQLKRWDKTDSKEELTVGKPIRCLLCNGSLILNSTVFRQHKNSNKHLRRRASITELKGEEVEATEAFCFAEEYKTLMRESGDLEEEELETHQERAMRLRESLKSVDDGSKNGKNACLESKQTHLTKSKSKKNKRNSNSKRTKRPGKRQRAQMRALQSAGGL